MFSEHIYPHFHSKWAQDKNRTDNIKRPQSITPSWYLVLRRNLSSTKKQYRTKITESKTKLKFINNWSNLYVSSLIYVFSLVICGSHMVQNKLEKKNLPFTIKTYSYQSLIRRKYSFKKIKTKQKERKQVKLLCRLWKSLNIHTLCINFICWT